MAVGEYLAFSLRPEFPAFRTTEGWYLLIGSHEPMVATGHPGPGIGGAVGRGAETAPLASAASLTHVGPSEPA